ncbi:unnamed protein product [Clonostachys solani]|uniref:Mitochondrial intermembrane space import and assembly protein 40 n=1 Tax=Clonostachys solani TaxID=160281 RepID=A0A9N9ZLY2_9HYPO|nr:unnamed protein product [Clonostachys solani]
MYRTALRTASRPALRCMRLQGQTATKRFASTSTPANKPRSWKSSALRWGLAGGAIYYYTTSSLFADDTATQAKTIPEPPQFAESDLPTVDSVLEEKRKQIQAKIEKEAPVPASSQEPGPDAAPVGAEGEAPAEEEGAGQQAAFNPETGEINWDCPCLGGMAHGPCGEEFKTAFSCFVFSETDPKGMDCIDKFQGMQTCFKQYPEIYGAELTDDGDDDDVDTATPADAPLNTEGAPTAQAETKETPIETSTSTQTPAAEAAPTTPKEEVKPEAKKEPKVETKKEEAPPAPSPRVVEPPAPAWEDARGANTEGDKQ